MNTVRVYKTDIDDKSKAETILDAIRQDLPGSIPSLDLEDCDKVLRIESKQENIDAPAIKNILASYGYTMEPLP